MTDSYGRWVLPAAGVLLALATVAGALGAHAFAGHWSAERLSIYYTAVRYQFYQSLGLLGMGLLRRGHQAYGTASAGPTAVQSLARAPWLLLSGIILFCGSLYVLSFGVTARWIGIATPVGGAALILGWLEFAYAAWRVSRPS
jgi:uncharacterized membrane protein YgdD (TMEM256/DUF423 family)